MPPSHGGSHWFDPSTAHHRYFNIIQYVALRTITVPPRQAYASKSGANHLQLEGQLRDCFTTYKRRKNQGEMVVIWSFLTRKRQSMLRLGCREAAIHKEHQTRHWIFIFLTTIPLTGSIRPTHHPLCYQLVPNFSLAITVHPHAGGRYPEHFSCRIRLSCFNPHPPRRAGATPADSW